MRTLIILAFTALCFFSCDKANKSQVKLISEENFKAEIDGKSVNLYTLESENNMTMQVTNYGGRVIALWVADRDGQLSDVVLGHNTIGQYTDYEGERFIGCAVGRYANRIANGEFSLDEKTYQVPKNNNGQSLHGGLKGLDMVVWDVDKVTKNEIQFSYLSPDGEEGYPGALKIKMTYTLTADNEFKIIYTATTDNATVINLSHHGFFNLKGEGGGTIGDHVLMLKADQIVPVNEVLIPTGELRAVDGTPFDFRTPTRIDEKIDADDEQLKHGLGYDHNWVLNRKTPKGIELAASVYEPVSGRYMEVWTDQPGIQFYSGNFFEGLGKGKDGAVFNYREAIALETQHFPDSPNQPSFPSTRLNPGEEYKHTCIYKFSTK